VRPGGKSEILARLRQHQAAAPAGAPARRPRPAGLPPCKKLCAKGCALCMKVVSGAVLLCLRALFNGWIVERCARAHAAPRRGERVLLKLLEERVVSAVVVSWDGVRATLQYKERRAGKKKSKRMEIAVKPAHFTRPASLMPDEWIQACIRCGNDAPVLLGGQAEVRYRFNLYMERWRAALRARPAALEDDGCVGAALADDALQVQCRRCLRWFVVPEDETARLPEQFYCRGASWEVEGECVPANSPPRPPRSPLPSPAPAMRARTADDEEVAAILGEGFA